MGEGDALPLYIDDDLTNEDAVAAISGRGISVVVRGGDRVTTADYALEDTADVRRFLEDLVNIPNWLPLAIKAGGGDCMWTETVEYLDYRQELHLRAGVPSRVLRVRDAEGRVTRWDERRIVSMHDPHLAALSLTLTPENWSGPLTLRSAINSRIINGGSRVTACSKAAISRRSAPAPRTAACW